MNNIVNICNKLINYEYKGTKPIVIVGPDFTDKNKLRVYVNGGLLGKVYIGNRANVRSELIDEEYDNSFLKTGKLNKLIEYAKKNSLENEVIVSPEYLEMAIKAIENKFAKKSRNIKTTEDNEKERHVEARIVKKYMNTTKNWAIVDMEVQFPKSYFENVEFSAGTTKAPRFDLVVINEKGLGIIELKVNNENCDNMLSHYEHMTYVHDNPENFSKEFERRIEILGKYELISQKTFQQYKNLLKQGELPLWCGFLFIGGGKEGAQQIAKKLDGKEKVKDIKFMYYDDYDLAELNINEMVSYEEFIG